MSRSYIHNKYIREDWKSDKRNPHKLDNLPKNKPSKRILSQVSEWKTRWLEKTPFCRGHYRPKNYHNLINGMVRAGEKEDVRKMIEEQLYCFESSQIFGKE